MNKLNFLLKLYRNPDTALEHKKIVALLYNYYLNDSSKSLDAEYALCSNQDSIEDSQTSISELEGNDYRISNLSLSNFRKFPSPSNTQSLYTIPFNKDGKPYSFYITGANGTGKSSLYCALQYAFNGNVAKYQNHQLVFGFERQDSSKIKEAQVVIQCGGKSALNGKLKYHFPNAMFCSDEDVISANSKDALQFLFENMGYEDLFILENDVQELNKSLSCKLEILKESKPIEYNADEEKDIINLLMAIYTKRSLRGQLPKLMKLCDGILSASNNYLSTTKDDFPVDIYMAYSNTVKGLCKQLSDIIKDKSISYIVKKVSSYANVIEDPLTWMPEDFPRTKADLQVYAPTTNLRNIINKVASNIGEDKSVKLEDVTRYIVESNKRKESRNQMNAAKEDLERVETYIGGTQMLMDAIKASRDKIRDELLQTYLPMCEEIMNRFSPKDEIIDFQPLDNSIQIRIRSSKVLPSGNTVNFEAAPEEFYNTFRYKLYVVSLKIASLFAYMKNNGCNLPFVMDDIFTASDFDNSNKLVEFVRIVYKEYRKLFSKDEFQLVLLTHDTVVQNAFRAGSQYIDEGSGKLCVVPHEAGRLFHYESSKDIKTMIGNDVDYEPIILNV